MGVAQTVKVSQRVIIMKDVVASTLSMVVVLMARHRLKEPASMAVQIAARKVIN